MAANADEAGRALRNYDAGYLTCRRGNLGHSWRVIGFYREGGHMRRLLRCTRCHTERRDHWDRDGTRYTPSYDYPEAYALRLESGGYVEAADVRVEALRRATVYANEAAMLEALTNSKGKR